MVGNLLIRFEIGVKTDCVKAATTTTAIRVKFNRWLARRKVIIFLLFMSGKQA
jgi:hypothetical protein